LDDLLEQVVFGVPLVCVVVGHGGGGGKMDCDFCPIGAPLNTVTVVLLPSCCRPVAMDFDWMNEIFWQPIKMLPPTQSWTPPVSPGLTFQFTPHTTPAPSPQKWLAARSSASTIQAGICPGLTSPGPTSPGPSTCQS